MCGQGVRYLITIRTNCLPHVMNYFKYLLNCCLYFPNKNEMQMMQNDSFLNEMQQIIHEHVSIAK